MSEDKKLKAYIIKDLVDRENFDTNELRGINNFLDMFDITTLKYIATDLDIAFREDI